MFDIPLNTGLIDSLTIYLPLDKIKVLDKRLISEFVCHYVHLDDADDEPQPPKPIIIQDNGINFRFNRVVFPPKKDTPAQELIRLTLTTKMLFGQYFTGININNISNIVDYINTTKIIEIDLDTVLNSICNDIDICINYRLLFEPYKESCFMLKKMVKISKQEKVSIFPRKQTERIDKNFGIIFGNRDTGSVGSPFCKFYNKTEELINHSTEFYNNYIFPQLKYGLNIDNLIRKEITIKNSAFKQSLIKKRLVSSENPLKCLKDILLITTDELTKICNVQLKYYYDKKQFHISEDLSPTEKIISYYMVKLVELGADKLALYEPLDLIECKVQRSRSKKKIDELMEVVFKTDYLAQKIEQNSISNQFLKMQDIW